MRFMDHRCASDSDPSEAPSDDSDNSSAAPPRRYRASQKASRSRNNKVRTLNRWTTEEHDKLAYLVDKWGSEKNWAKVAEEMPGRTGKQCRERWLNHMKPGIIKGNWSPEEEFLLAQCHALVGSHWSKMTKRLPGRTENSIKNFWNATLRSKAPNKKRGMLWTYMQLHDPKSDDNTHALITAVTRLHETRELPPHLLAQLDAGLLDGRTWKSVHKAEKDYLENIGGELHYMALPHPGPGSLAAQASQQLLTVAHAQVTGASPTGSPLASSSQVPEYACVAAVHMLAPGGGSQAAPGAYDGGAPAQGGAVKAEPGAGEPYGVGTLEHSMVDGALMAAVPGPIGVPGGATGAAAAAAYAAAAMPNLLTAQDPLLSCVPDGLDHEELLRMFESGGASAASTAGGHHAPQPPHHGQLPGLPAVHANNGALYGPADGALHVLPPPQGLAPIATSRPDGSQDGCGYAQDGGKAEGAAAHECGSAAEQGSAAGAAGFHHGHMPLSHISPMPSCEQGTGTPMNGSPLLNAIGAHDQQAAFGAAGATAAAVAEFNRRQAGSPAYSDTRSDVTFGPSGSGRANAAGGGTRPAGGHGPHCSCGPCSNSRKLHGLHSPGARRNARNNANAAGGRYRALAHQGSDVATSFQAPASKLQRQSYAVQHDLGSMPAGYVDTAAGGYVQQQQQQHEQLQQHQQQHQAQQHQQQQQQHYYDAVAGGCHAGVVAAAPGDDYSTVQAAAFHSFTGSSGAGSFGGSAAPGGAATPRHTMQEPRCESPFAQHAAAGWDAAPPAAPAAELPAVLRPDMQPATQGVAAVVAEPAMAPEVLGSMPWLATAKQLQPPQEQAGQLGAAAQGAAPPQQQQQQNNQQQQQQNNQQQQQQQQTNQQRPADVKLDLAHLAGASPGLTGLLLSPLGLGLLSPLGGLMLPPSTRSVRLPSFGQITIQRASINGAEWDWDALMSADIGAGGRSARPSDNGEGALAALAAGLGSVQRAGNKRARCSLTSVEDDAALLIDMQPASKVARGAADTAPTPGSLYAAAPGGGGAWSARDFLARFD